jgi:hypothetical protein
MIMKVYVIYGGHIGECWVEYVYATFELAYAHFDNYYGMSHNQKIEAIHEFEVLTSIS